MTKEQYIKLLQREIGVTPDGDYGPVTTAKSDDFDIEVVAHKKERADLPQVPGAFTHRHPIDWARGELGQKEIPGRKDNPRIRWYHTHCANIGSKEHPDEVPWCSSFINAAADECGCEKTDNALAASWKKYGNSRKGDWVEEGDIVVLGTRHVTLANKRFNRKTAKRFEGLGGNQGNACKVSTYSVSEISSVQEWRPKSGTKLAPIGTKPGLVSADGDKESVV